VVATARVSGFDYSILKHTAHRPWPMPSGPWVMTQTWCDLLFAHWRVNASDLRAKVPPEFTLDLFDGSAWLGIVAFHVTNVAPRGVPALRWVSEFPELNVRTYVRVADEPGIFFFSLDAGSALAVHAAKTMLNLPYFTASMSAERRRCRAVPESSRCVSRRGSVPRQLRPGWTSAHCGARIARVLPDGAVLPL